LRILYSTVLYLLIPLALLHLFFSGLKNRAYWSGWSERFGFKTFSFIKKPVIWIHAVSVGEVQAIISLVNQIHSLYPQYHLHVTTITPTGAELVRQKLDQSITHSYLPYDLPGVVKRFLQQLKPRIAIIMETELWPNLYANCENKGIQILLINVRISDKSFRRYKKLVFLLRQVLSDIALIASQTRQDRQRLIDLGANPDKVLITGNLKFDQPISKKIIQRAFSIRNKLRQYRRIWIAGSTHEGEEELIFRAHKQILKKHPSSLLIIVPRHPERFNKVMILCKRQELKYASVSDNQELSTENHVLIVDTMGELLVYYAVSDVAFVGGSLLPFGGHNVLEPAGLGIPVISGMHGQNFREINAMLLKNDAELRVRDEIELAEKVSLLFSDKKLRQKMGESGRQVVGQNKGSTDRILTLIAERL